MDEQGIQVQGDFELASEDVAELVLKALGTLETALGDTVRALLKNPNHSISSSKGNQITDMKFPLNQILYGPPGTGKTYHTVNKALEILGVDTKGWDRLKIKESYDKYVSQGRIVFTTFHQSMSYEDFIEGIKPKIEDEPAESDAKEPKTLSPRIGDGDLKYVIQPGIFQALCATARMNLEDAEIKEIRKPTFEEAFARLRSDWEKDKAMKFSLRSKGYEFTIRDITDKHVWLNVASGGVQALFLKTLENVFGGHELQFDRGTGIYYKSVRDHMRAYELEVKTKIELQPYVLIIDEINRGNVSQIFGELITLIEEDKRFGKAEALEVKLPYSKAPFSVPPNLHIIGTMNTADRSVEALDAALRRRFCFEEMLPRPELLNPARMLYEFWWKYEKLKWEDPDFMQVESPFYAWLGAEFESGERERIWDKMVAEKKDSNKSDYFAHKQFTGINLQLLLETLNKRLEVLRDKDHTIGHSFFMGVDSMASLMGVFRDKVLPLLQEYFYGDMEKLRLVLGDGFFDDESKNNSKLPDKFFAKSEFADPDEYSDQKRHHLRDWPRGQKFAEGDEDLKAFDAAIKNLLNQK